MIVDKALLTRCFYSQICVPVVSSLLSCIHLLSLSTFLLIGLTLTFITTEDGLVLDALLVFLPQVRQCCITATRSACAICSRRWSLGSCARASSSRASDARCAGPSLRTSRTRSVRPPLAHFSNSPRLSLIVSALRTNKQGLPTGPARLSSIRRPLCWMVSLTSATRWPPKKTSTTICSIPMLRLST